MVIITIFLHIIWITDDLVVQCLYDMKKMNEI